MPTKNQNHQGQRFTGTLFGKKSIREALVEMLNCFYNPKITLKTRNADGSNTDLSPAEIKMGPLGWTAEIDLTNLGPYGGASSQTIIPATFYNIANTANNADTWRTFQWRDFIFGGRSKWKTATAYGDFNGIGELASSGNGELKMFIVNDFAWLDGDLFAQPTALTTQGILDDTAETEIYDPAINFGPGTFGQIVLNNTHPEVDGTIQAAFWLAIIDDGTDYYARLTGRMFSATGTGGRVTTPFPAVSENIIPLCIIEANPTAGVFIRPIQTGSLVNRYVPGVTPYRGAWTADALAGQIFFPGDLVLDETASPYDFTVSSGTAHAYKMYRYIAGVAPAVQNFAPHTVPANWAAIYTIAAP